MINIKSIILSAVLTSTIIFSGCTASTDDLADEVKASMAEEFKAKGEDITIESFSLIHKSGNEYKGILEAKVHGVESTHSVEVIYDGSSFTWELQD